MKTNTETTDVFFYVGWVFSGVVSFLFALAFAWVPLALIVKVVGDRIIG